METVTDRPVEMPGDTEPDLHLLTDWAVLQDDGRARTARAVSIALHVGVVLTWFLLPKSMTDPVKEAVVRHFTPLIEPLTDLTQPTPNQGKVNKEFNVESQAPRPRIRIPATPPAPVAPPAAPVRKLAPPPEKKAAPNPQPNLPDAPKVEVAQQTPQVNVPNTPQMAPPPPPPQIQPVEKPKLTLETPPPATGKGTGRLAPPGTSVEDALRSVMRGGGTSGMVVGDVDLMTAPSVRSSINAPALPGKSGAYMELKFDPQGVDFKPYLIQLLATIKRNWFTVWPDSARRGLQGRVVLQMAINRSRIVSKLVIASHSGSDQLDHAAVAGVGMTQEGGLPEFPTGYKADEIRLQLNFVYNMK